MRWFSLKAPEGRVSVAVKDGGPRLHPWPHFVTGVSQPASIARFGAGKTCHLRVRDRAMTADGAERAAGVCGLEVVRVREEFELAVALDDAAEEAERQVAAVDAEGDDAAPPETVAAFPTRVPVAAMAAIHGA